MSILEKPLATTIAEGVAIVAAAKTRGLRAGAAPDTVLGAGVQGARGLIDAGEIGKPMTGIRSRDVPRHGCSQTSGPPPASSSRRRRSVVGAWARLYQGSAWAVTDMRRRHSHAD